MKRRNRFIPLLLGATLSLSMVGTAVAADTPSKTQITAAVQKETTNSQDKTATVEPKAAGEKSGDVKDQASDKKEATEIFGRIKKVSKDSLEIETAVAEEEKTEEIEVKNRKETGFHLNMRSGFLGNMSNTWYNLYI